jgi:hypothetical protein
MTDEELLAIFRDTAETATRYFKEVADPNTTIPKSEHAERRRLAIGAFNQARQTAVLAAGDLRSARLTEATREYAADPIDDQAMTADLLAADQASRGMGKVAATSQLLPAGWDALRLGQIRKAEVNLRAAQLAGAFDTALVKAIEMAKCEIYPNRISSLAKGSIAHNAHAVSFLEIEKATANFQHLIGNGPEAVQSMITVRMADWVAAQAEGRPLKGDAELGLPALARPDPEYQGSHLDSRLRGVEPRHSS